jgi:predicted PurR-regulated permease PerM
VRERALAASMTGDPTGREGAGGERERPNHDRRGPAERPGLEGPDAGRRREHHGAREEPEEQGGREVSRHAAEPPPAATAPEPAPTRVPVQPAQLVRYAVVTITVLAVVAGVALLWIARSVVVAVFLGVFLAAGLEPIVIRLERFGMRRGLAVTGVLCGLLLVGGVFLFLALQPAISQITELVKNAPQVVETLSAQQNPIGRFISRPDVQRGLQSFLRRLPEMVTSSAGRILGAVGTVAAALVQAITVFVLMIYFMLAWPRIVGRTERVLARPDRVAVAREALGRIGGYVTGQLTVSILAGVIAYAFLAIAGVPYAAVLGMVVGFCDLIPQIGAGIGAAICAVVALSESVLLAVITVLFLLLYQLLENYLIAPRIFAKAVELSPAAVFVAALFGATVGGFVGAIVALPCAAALKVVIRYALRGPLRQPAVAAPPG